MKLKRILELYNPTPKYAWFEPSTNGLGMSGVRLAFIDPTMPRFNAQIDDADNKGDLARKERITIKRDNYKRQGQLSFPNSPDLGWWLTSNAFEAGEENEEGLTKGNIYQRHPDLEIFPSREEAEKAAKKTGAVHA